MKVLYVASNPETENTLLLEREVTDLQSRFANSSSSGVTFTFLPGLYIEQFPRELSRIAPDILHISAHGAESGLSLASASGRPRLLTVEALRAFLSIEKVPRLVILNACNSALVAKGIVGVVPMAVGMAAEPTNLAGREATRLFYERILAGQSVTQAFTACRAMIKTIEDSTASAVLHVQRGLNADREFFLASPKILARFERNAKRDKNGEYEFGIGIVGCPGNTRQVVFFVDNDGFAEDNEDELEDAMCIVVRRKTERRAIWADSTWYGDSDFRIFATGTTADGEHFTTSASVSDAIKSYVKFKTKDSHAKLSKSMADAVDSLSMEESDIQAAIAEANLVAEVRARVAKTRLLPARVLAKKAPIRAHR